jgi:hypothetical protein
MGNAGMACVMRFFNLQSLFSFWRLAMKENPTLILSEGGGCYEITDGEILGAIMTVVFDFAYTPEQDGGQWEPSFPTDVSVTTITAIRWERSDYLPSGRYWPHDEEIRTDITALFTPADMDRFAEEILEEVERTSPLAKKRPAYRSGFDDHTLRAIEARGVTGYATL